MQYQPLPQITLSRAEILNCLVHFFTLVETGPRVAFLPPKWSYPQNGLPKHCVATTRSRWPWPTLAHNSRFSTQSSENMTQSCLVHTHSVTHLGSFSDPKLFPSHQWANGPVDCHHRDTDTCHTYSKLTLPRLSYHSSGHSGPWIYDPTASNKMSIWRSIGGPRKCLEKKKRF